MTLEDAIKHAEEVAEVKYGMADGWHTDEGIYLSEEIKCRECAEEHEQLAEWLKELKQYREQTDGDLISRQKAIDTIDALYLDGDSAVSYRADAESDTLIGKYQVITALDDLPSAEKTADKTDSVLEDIKEEINQIRILHNSSGIGYGLDIALGIIDKHISGKEE